MKEYLGDGVYAQYTSYGDIILTTEDGIRQTNRIILEPNVIQVFLDFIKRNEE